jgi:hypothetical protein
VNEYEAGPAAEDAEATRIAPGQVHTGTLRSSSAVYSSRLVEVYEFWLPRSANITVRVDSDELDAFLYLVLPDGNVITDDDGGGFTNSQLTLESAERGLYRVYASSFGGQAEGAVQVSWEID